MAYVVAEPCIGMKDKTCVSACPVDCILEGRRMLYIDPEACVDCGACVDACAVQAIYPSDGLPGKWKFYAEINRRWASNGRNDEAAWKGFEPVEASKKSW